MLSKFDDRLSGKCTLSGCDFFPGDSTHWLSFQCPALAPVLTSTFNNVIEVLRPWPLLLDVVHDALSRSPVEIPQCGMVKIRRRPIDIPIRYSD